MTSLRVKSQKTVIFSGNKLSPPYELDRKRTLVDKWINKRNLKELKNDNGNADNIQHS